jgi:hypothetical protein
MSGAAGEQYELPVWNPAQISAVDGAELVRRETSEPQLRVKIPDEPANPYPPTKVVLHFSSTSRKHK